MFVQFHRRALGLFFLWALAQCHARAARADSADDQYAVAAGHYASEHREMAVDEFSALLKDHPDSPKANQATFFLGEALVQLGRYSDAHARFVLFLERDPHGALASQALFRAGETAVLDGKNDPAREAFTKFRAAYPEDPLNAYACYIWARSRSTIKMRRLRISR